MPLRAAEESGRGERGQTSLALTRRGDAEGEKMKELYDVARGIVDAGVKKLRLPESWKAGKLGA